MIRRPDAQKTWNCVVCKRILLIHERPQPGLPPVCDFCLRTHQQR